MDPFKEPEKRTTHVALPFCFLLGGRVLQSSVGV